MNVINYYINQISKYNHLYINTFHKIKYYLKIHTNSVSNFDTYLKLYFSDVERILPALCSICAKNRCWEMRQIYLLPGAISIMQKGRETCLSDCF